MTKPHSKNAKITKTSARSAKSQLPERVIPSSRVKAVVRSKTDNRRVTAADRVFKAPFMAAVDQPRISKKAQLIALLHREQGAPLAEMTKLFGWLPHSVRAAMTGLRRDGHYIIREKGEDGLAQYRMAKEA